MSHIMPIPTAIVSNICRVITATIIAKPAAIKRERSNPPSMELEFETSPGAIIAAKAAIGTNRSARCASGGITQRPKITIIEYRIV